MKCPYCKNQMTNEGNISNAHYMTDPPQWDEVHACHKCKVTKTLRVYGERIETKDLSGYTEIKE